MARERSGTYNPSRPNLTARHKRQRFVASLAYPCDLIPMPCVVRSDAASCGRERRSDQRPLISWSQIRALARPHAVFRNPYSEANKHEGRLYRHFSLFFCERLLRGQLPRLCTTGSCKEPMLTPKAILATALRRQRSPSGTGILPPETGAPKAPQRAPRPSGIFS